MILTLILLSMCIAGFVVVYTQLREETTLLQRCVNLIPYPVSHALNCPFCTSYWLALLAAILVDPLKDWSLSWRWSTDIAWLLPLFRIAAAWYLVGFLANFWRVLYMLVGKDMSLVDLEARKLRRQEPAA